MSANVQTMYDSVKTRFEVLDPRFARCQGDERTERLFTGARWAEGPAYFPAGRYLLFSDIPNDRIMRWDEVTGSVGEFRHAAGYPNGHTVDRAGRLVSCEQGNRRVTRTNHDGSVVVLADRFDGRRFNSPNDVVEHSDGSIWFTDPSYGIDSDYEGHRAVSEIRACHVFRLDPNSGRVTVVGGDFLKPNGLAFSADESQFYVVDTERKHVKVFDVGADAGLANGTVFATCDAGSFDGLRLDSDGRVWVAAHDGLHCFDPDGTLLGKLRLPEICSNLTFGGPRRNHLFVTASSSVYALRTNFNGARRAGEDH
jgi:gluconolactonase